MATPNSDSDRRDYSLPPVYQFASDKPKPVVSGKEGAWWRELFNSGWDEIYLQAHQAGLTDAELMVIIRRALIVVNSRLGSSLSEKSVEIVRPELLLLVRGLIEKKVSLKEQHPSPGEVSQAWRKKHDGG
jgi:hypothetical protein